jgi:hypothetical protein
MPDARSCRWVPTNRAGTVWAMLMSISLSNPSVDDTASIRLGQTRRKTPFPGVDREEIHRPAVWQTPSSWIYLLRMRRLQPTLESRGGRA